MNRGRTFLWSSFCLHVPRNGHVGGAIQCSVKTVGIFWLFRKI